jgi:hypothetical protein
MACSVLSWARSEENTSVSATRISSHPIPSHLISSHLAWSRVLTLARDQEYRRIQCVFHFQTLKPGQGIQRYPIDFHGWLMTGMDARVCALLRRATKSLCSIKTIESPLPPPFPSSQVNLPLRPWYSHAYSSLNEHSMGKATELI